MYSALPQVLELTALMLAHGITHVVVCAGSRSAPLAHTFASCPKLSCTPLVDERSAAFTALGMCEALGRPVAICCTSGSALLDMAPAVAEAFHRQLPLLVVSADRPAAWIGQMDAQTLEQPGALRNFVKKEVSLPEPRDEESRWHMNRLVNEALLALDHEVPGPVHINVPLAEPLFDFSAKELPAPRVIRRSAGAAFAMDDGLAREWRQSARPMIVVGQLAPGNGLAPVLETLAAAGALVVVEQLSNLPFLEKGGGRANVVCQAEPLLAAPELAGTGEEARSLAPDLVVTLGGHVVSKRLKLFLRRVQPAGHWHVSGDGAACDLFRRLTRCVQGTAIEVLEALAKCPRARTDASFLTAWNGRETAARRCIRDYRPAVFCDLSVMRRFLARMPAGCALQLGNSMPLRNAAFFPLPPDTHVFCNRGVNGIDGSLSVATGYASISPRATFCPVGDLSFFYDANALWREDIPRSLRILLFRNGGGAIFHTLPGLDSPHTDRFIAGKNTRSAEGLAKDAGLACLPARNEEELEAALARFCRPAGDGDGPLLLEAFTDMEACTRESRALTAAVAAGPRP